MSRVLQDEALAMFFDEDFNAAAYVDALFLSISGSADRYSPHNLAQVSDKTLDLIMHLDYNTNEISRELARKIDQLKKLSGAVVGGDYDSDATRLQYYIDLLKNSVDLLQGDVDSARTLLVPDKLASESPIELLILLKTVKENIARVSAVLLKASKTVGATGELAVSVDDFQAALGSLLETLKTRLRDSDSEDKAELAESVREMRTWVPMFQPFTRFGPVYLKFVARLEAELSA